jgi:hypothetical protein
MKYVCGVERAGFGAKANHDVSRGDRGAEGYDVLGPIPHRERHAITGLRTRG